MFCGSLVLSLAEEQSISGDSKAAQRRKEKLLKQFEVTNVCYSNAMLFGGIGRSHDYRPVCS